jgi:glycolate oxidase iron-sulfur subunit
MQTSISPDFANTSEGQEADAILRSCVHCGFCTATCPTYQLLGDELDGPRGRIYLIKQVLEGNEVTRHTQLHLDRCLTCRSCESTCPSGVRYGRLVDIGRHIVEQKVERPLSEKLMRAGLRAIVPYNNRFGTALKLGQAVRVFLPGIVRQKIPVRENAGVWPRTTHARKILVLDGCVQPSAAPNINAAAARVLDKFGIQLVRAPKAGCCGAVSQHLSVHDEALDMMRRNIDAWWPFVENGIEAIAMTASGCGSVVTDYGVLLQHDVNYAAKAKRIGELTQDISKILAKEDLAKLGKVGSGKKIAFHAPCSLQHGQKVVGVVEQILVRAGYKLTSVSDSHICCGSAGTYSILQSELSQQLLKNKLKALQSDAPDIIASANIGCQMHLATKSNVPVKHWIELLDKTNAVR